MLYYLGEFRIIWRAILKKYARKEHKWSCLLREADFDLKHLFCKEAIFAHFGGHKCSVVDMRCLWLTTFTIQLKQVSAKSFGWTPKTALACLKGSVSHFFWYVFIYMLFLESQPVSSN